MQARATVAELLSEALNEAKTARDVIAVAAAEGVGFVDAMERCGQPACPVLLIPLQLLLC